MEKGTGWRRGGFSSAEIEVLVVPCRGRRMWYLLRCSVTKCPQHAGAFSLPFRVLSRNNMFGDVSQSTDF